jgi:hypothetical protein
MFNSLNATLLRIKTTEYADIDAGYYLQQDE